MASHSFFVRVCSLNCHNVVDVCVFHARRCFAEFCRRRQFGRRRHVVVVVVAFPLLELWKLMVDFDWCLSGVFMAPKFAISNSSICVAPRNMLSSQEECEAEGSARSFQARPMNQIGQAVLVVPVDPGVQDFRCRPEDRPLHRRLFRPYQALPSCPIDPEDLVVLAVQLGR